MRRSAWLPRHFRQASHPRVTRRYTPLPSQGEFKPPYDKDADKRTQAKLPPPASRPAKFSRGLPCSRAALLRSERRSLSRFAGGPRIFLFGRSSFGPPPPRSRNRGRSYVAAAVAQVAQSVKSSLAHLGIDYIDSYLLHGPTSAKLKSACALLYSAHSRLVPLASRV